MKPILSPLSDLPLAEIPAASWELLRQGAAGSREPFHTGCLATAGALGPSQRTVVLRLVDEPGRLLACHTDRRSLKLEEARGNGASSWLFYDPERKLQLRLEGRLYIHLDDELADSRWEATRSLGRACYNTLAGPGQPVVAPAAAPAPPTDPSEASLAREHFAVLSFRVDFLDWLYLSIHGHRRAQFRWEEQGLQGNWVNP
jgi:hypothetical protein